MKELITMAFRQVRGIRDIFLPEESTPIFANMLENLREMVSVHKVDHVVIEGETGSFHIRFSDDGWVGVSADNDANDFLVRAALDRTAKFLKKHRRVKQRINHMREDIEELFVTNGVAARVRHIDLSVESDSLTGKIQLSAREERKEAIIEQVQSFLEKLLPYFIKNNVTIIIERQTLLDRITREQLLKIIKRVERI